jgi:hypothetical protein
MDGCRQRLRKARGPPGAVEPMTIMMMMIMMNVLTLCMSVVICEIYTTFIWYLWVPLIESALIFKIQIRISLNILV